MGSMADAAQEKASHGDVDHGLGHVEALLVIAHQQPPVVHAADVQDRDGGVLVMATLFVSTPSFSSSMSMADTRDLASKRGSGVS
jgi:hypothetical protein